MQRSSLIFDFANTCQSCLPEPQGTHMASPLLSCNRVDFSGQAILIMSAIWRPNKRNQTNIKIRYRIHLDNVSKYEIRNTCEQCQQCRRQEPPSLPPPPHFAPLLSLLFIIFLQNGNNIFKKILKITVKILKLEEVPKSAKLVCCVMLNMRSNSAAG